MVKNKHLNNILHFNIALVILSTSGALGRYIDLPVPVIICLRSIIGALFLIAYCRWRNISLYIEKKDRKLVLLGGLCMGLHWLTYFQALKLSNVAVGMLSMFTYPVLTAFLEPVILKTKFQKVHILLGVIALLGIYFLVPEFSFESSYSKAIGYGVLSAFFYSLRNLIMKPKVAEYNGSVLMLYQLVIIGFLLLPAIFIQDMAGFQSQIAFLLILAVFTTAIGHTLFLTSLKHFSTTTASLISSIQPVYGILIGIVFIQDVPAASTIIGGLLILTTVIIESIRTR